MNSTHLGSSSSRTGPDQNSGATPPGPPAESPSPGTGSSASTPVGGVASASSPPSSAGDDATERAIAAAYQTAGAAAELAKSVRTAAHTAAEAVTAQLGQRPYITLGVVAGVGFVVAGGLAAPAFRSMTGLCIRLGFAAAARKLEDVLAASAAPVTDAGPPAR